MKPIDYDTLTAEAPAPSSFSERGGGFSPPPPYPSTYRNPHLDPAPDPTHMQIGARGFGQTFGLVPWIAVMTLMVDGMIFIPEVASGGLLLPLSVACGVILGVITYRAQKRFYQDDHEAALIKAMALGFLTAIPTPIPAVFYLPAGAVGLFHQAKKALKGGH